MAQTETETAAFPHTGICLQQFEDSCSLSLSVSLLDKERKMNEMIADRDLGVESAMYTEASWPVKGREG